MDKGDNENYCLDRIKSICLENNNGFFLPYIDKATEITYGLSFDDVNDISRILTDAVPNKAKSEFPDFVFDGGFIEHFQVTSSKDSKKGSLQQKSNGDAMRENQKYLQTSSEKIIEQQDKVSAVIGTKVKVYTSCEHSYDNFVSSFKKHWESHIESLKKYDGNMDIGIFMIECLDAGVSMCEKLELKEGISVGTLALKPEIFPTIHLSRCKELLNYILGYKDKIKYVIYVTVDGVEIIKTSEAEYISSLLKNGYVFASNDGFNLMHTSGVTVRKEDMENSNE